MSHKCYYSPKSIFWRNWGEIFFIINALFLNKTLGNKISLVSLNITFWILLGIKYSFTTNGIHTFRQFNEIPYIIIFHGFQLTFYGINLLLKNIYFFFGLKEINWIIFYYSYIELMFLEKYNIIMWNHTSLFSDGSSQWHFLLKLLSLLFKSNIYFK